MKPLNSNVELQLTVRSPLHVGTSQENNWTQGIDFVQEHGRLFCLDKLKVWKALDDRSKERYMDFLGRAQLAKIEAVVKQQLDLEEVSRYVFEDAETIHEKEIKSLLLNGQGRPYIPGSSIKGALFSAIFNFLYHQTYPSDNYRNLHRTLLGDFGASINRFVRPSDAYFRMDQTEVGLVELFNLYDEGQNYWESDYKPEFTLAQHMFKPGATSSFRLSIADGLGTFIKSRRKESRGRIRFPKNYQEVITEKPIQHLFNIINAYTRRHIEKEIQFFTTYDQAEGSEDILEKLEKLKLKTQEAANSCILRMAGGTGFHNITGDWRFDDHLHTIDRPDGRNRIWNYQKKTMEAARYKSRKVVTSFMELMGFVELKLAKSTNVS